MKKIFILLLVAIVLIGGTVYLLRTSSNELPQKGSNLPDYLTASNSLSKGKFTKGDYTYGLNEIDTGTTICRSIFWKRDDISGKIEKEYKDNSCFSKEGVYKQNLFIAEHAEGTGGDMSDHIPPTTIKILNLDSFVPIKIYEDQTLIQFDDTYRINSIIESYLKTNQGSIEIVASAIGNQSTKDWPIYKSDYGIEVKYPLGWKVIQEVDSKKVNFPTAFLLSVSFGTNNLGNSGYDGDFFLFVYNKSADNVEDLIKEMGDQYRDRQEERESMIINGIKGLRVSVTSPTNPRWNYEAVFFEDEQKIFFLSNGAIPNSQFSGFYDSFTLK